MNERFNNTKKASILGITGNVFLLMIKAIVGAISGSQAMIADAANSAGDIFASLMTFISNKIASEPSDDTHNFGHGKAEYIFSLFISISMLLVASKLLYDSTLSLIFKQEFVFSWTLVIVCLITIITFETIYPACCSSNSAIKLTLEELEKISNYKKWIDVCKHIDKKAV